MNWIDWRAFLLAMVAAFLALDTPAQADEISNQEAVFERLRIAGEQRLLVQQVAKSTCFFMMGHEPVQNAEEAFIAAMTFEGNADTLMSGSASNGIPAEEDDAILAHLHALLGMWETFGPAMRQVTAGDFHTVPVRQVIYLNDTVLEEANMTVEEIEQVYGGALVARHQMTSTLNVAGLQSMLTQKMAKEVCLIYLGIRSTEMRAALAQSRADFEVGLIAMANGDYDLGVMDPPNLAALKAMADMKDAWDMALPVVQRALGENNISAAELRSFAQQAGTLLSLTDGMINIYLQ